MSLVIAPLSSKEMVETILNDAGCLLLHTFKFIDALINVPLDDANLSY